VNYNNEIGRIAAAAPSERLRRAAQRRARKACGTRGQIRWRAEAKGEILGAEYNGAAGEQKNEHLAQEVFGRQAEDL